MSPFFSIIVPCYNHAKFLKQNIESVLSQSFSDWELIIVNDGSTDNSGEVGFNFAVKDNRVRLINKENRGLAAARNSGMQHARGSVYLFLDADDFLLIGCLDKVYKSFYLTPATDVVLVGYRYVDEAGESTIHEVSASKLTEWIPDIFTRNIGPCHSVFIRQNVVQQAGFFDETLRSAEDWDFWIRVGKIGALVARCPHILVAYRYVRNSMSRNGYQLYFEQKKVILRGPTKDSRLGFSVRNKDYDVSVLDGLKRQLFGCLGLMIMQGKIEESKSLYLQEQGEFGWSVEPSEFSNMYTYLSFRYWHSSSDVASILNEYYPNFKLFFKSIGLNGSEYRKSLRAVFKTVFKLNNKQRYGYLFGGLANRLQLNWN